MSTVWFCVSYTKHKYGDLNGSLKRPLENSATIPNKIKKHTIISE